MPTLAQALLLGGERLSAPPTPPHASLASAWAQLDWAGAKENTLLSAAALAGTARAAGPVAAGPIPAVDPAPAETLPSAPPRAVAVLRQLFAEEARPLLPEWLELCAQRGARVPPFFLRTLLDLARTSAERAALLPVLGERGRWLALHNESWSWVLAAAPALDPSLWETGSEEERIACLRQLRASDPARALESATKTWADDTPEFRARVLEAFAPTLSPADEPFLTRILTERRKELRVTAQALLATLPGSVLAGRMRATAELLLQFQNGFLSKKLEVALPAAFDPAWKADAIEEKPPAGVGEKAHWAQQILGLVPVSAWTKKFSLNAADLIALAGKSTEWSALLLGAWTRSAILHRDASAAAALIDVLAAQARRSVVNAHPNTHPTVVAASLLAVCTDEVRWRVLGTDAAIAWHALAQLQGTPSLAQGRALLEQLAPAIRDGFNPGGSPTAMLAARRIPVALREEAARLFTRDNGLSKPAEAFLHALELRAAMQAAFS
ncbi:MAG: DUF5691 domain-containing protein [Verrucomicrobiota bacterium]